MNQGTSDVASVDISPTGAGRCAAAHTEDGRPCDGPADAVRIFDRDDEQATGCVRHGAALLASLSDGRMYPGSVAGAAIEAHRTAQTLRPFQFRDAADGGQERVEWPPVEQDDTSDEVHEQPWWQNVSDKPSDAEVAQALAVFGAEPTGPGVWHGHTKARQCVDIRATGDPVVVREALREAVDAGMLSPAEAVEVWPAGDEFRPAVETAAALVDDVPAGTPFQTSGRGLAFADWLMEAEADALAEAGVDVESVIEAANRWERELLPGLLDRITGRTAGRDAVRVDDDADGW